MQSSTLRTCRRSLAGAAALACLATGPSACGDAPTAGDDGLSPEEFIAIVVELREIEREIVDSDSAAILFERRKGEVLERYETSEEGLRAFVDRHGTDLELMHAVWDSISDRLRHVTGPDSLADDAARPEPFDTTSAADSAADTARSAPPVLPDSVREPRMRRLLLERPDSLD